MKKYMKILACAATLTCLGLGADIIAFSKHELENMRVKVPVKKKWGREFVYKTTTAKKIMSETQYHSASQIPAYWVANENNLFEPQEVVLVEQHTLVRENPKFIFGFVVAEDQDHPGMYYVQVDDDAGDEMAIQRFNAADMFKFDKHVYRESADYQG